VTTSPIDISIIAPMYNESQVIGEFIEAVLSVLSATFTHYELILIDDGSTDETVDVCLSYVNNNSHIRLIVFSRNYGHEIASTAGFDHAKGEYVVLMDTDLQHPPAYIPLMYEKAKEGYDIVCAARSNRHYESWFKRFAAKSFYNLAKKMTGFDLSENHGNFRLLNQKVVKSLRRMRESNRHLIMMFAYVGFKKTELTVECPPRTLGKSKYNYLKLLQLSLDSIISFSSKPLRWMSLLSLFVSFLSMCYATFILIQKLFFNQHLADGVASVILLTAGLFSILFLFLAVISEYISRILVETKNRPLYIIKEDIQYDKPDV